MDVHCRGRWIAISVICVVTVYDHMVQPDKV